MDSKMEDHGGFQAAYLRSDSVSFGRFEAESLSWERRSSFSHNRYLEEVEKYSTPGSVNQKKALLEAHFKKKGMLHQNSSLGKNGMEGQIEKVICEDKVDESEDPHINGLQFEEFQNLRRDSVQFSWYDETPVISDDPEDCITDGEGKEVSSMSKIPAGATFEETLIEANSQQVEYEIVHCQVQSDLASAPENIQASEEKEFSSKTKIIHGLAEVKDRSAAKVPRDADHGPSKKVQKSSAKVCGKTSQEQKTIKTNTRPQAIVTQKQEKPSPDNKHIHSAKAPTKAPKKVERDRPRVTISDEYMHKRAVPSPATRLVKSNTTTKDSETVKGNKRGYGKSMEKCEKSLRANRPGVTANFTSANSEAVSRQSASRRTSGINAIKHEPKTTGAVFTFKSDERAEKRKEYNTKLEEMLLAKEAKKNEIQAKSQEERKTAMKQFRRGLTFKATPMPSFYQNEVNQSASGGKKVITSHAATPRQRSGSRNTGIKVMENSIQSLDNPNSPNPEVKTNSDQLISAEPGSEKLTEVLSEGSGKEGAAGNAKVPSQDIKGKLQQQQGESSNKVKKEEKSSKLKTSSAHKVMKGMIAGSTVVRVAS